MSDEHATQYEGLESPLDQFITVTPNDSVDLATVPRAIYIGVSGDLSIEDKDGTVVTLVGLAAGIWHPIRPYKVRATSTTADSIVAGY